MLSSFYVNTAECFLIIKIIIQKEFFCVSKRNFIPQRKLFVSWSQQWQRMV